MSSIKLLDTHTINKIAAGEVVERPASVIKEVVENSIDAKASTLTVEIKNGGIDLIRITDNGKGIPKDEVEIAFLRHATSKITTAEDLLEVRSLGFRGEALASIAAISKVELITKTPGEMTGKRVVVHGGKIQDSEEIACPEGTTLMMRQLFYNVPARKAFLKSSGTEASKIADYMYKLALAHPEISFKYIQNNKLIFTTPGNSDLKQCVFHLYGKDTAKNVFPISYEKDGIKIIGLIGNPSLTRGNRNYEQFFINGRYIKSYILQKAAEEAYKTRVTIGKFPFVLLHIDMEPECVDVNVHPTKLEVRFKDQDAIYQAVYDSILEGLTKESHIPDAMSKPVKEHLKPVTPQEEVKQVRMESFFTPHQVPKPFKPSNFLDNSNEIQDVQPYKRTSLFEHPSHNTSSKPQESTTHSLVDALEDLNEPIIIGEMPEHLNVVEVEGVPILQGEIPIVVEVPNIEKPLLKEHTDYKIIGQLFNTYWIIEYNEQLFMIDQHAAHERVMYEHYMKDFTTSSVSSQLLLMPETIHVSPSEREWISENLAFFKQLGFEVELFGEQHIVLREVPYLFNKPMSIQAARELLDCIDVGHVNNLYELKESDIIQMSCKSAIKAHDKLDERECKALIEALLNLENPFTCPHGRPTIVSLKKSDIEKIFKRIQ